MRNLNDVITLAEKCEQDLDSLHIDYDHYITWKINTRAKSRLGLCSYYGDGFKIEISSMLLDDDIEESILRDTIMHELLHTVPGCMNHGKSWARLAKIVNNVYCYHVTRIVKRDELNLPAPEYRYVVKCAKCGYEVGKMRYCGIIAHPEQYSHKKCGGTFKRVEFAEKTVACNAIVDKKERR